MEAKSTNGFLRGIEGEGIKSISLYEGMQQGRQHTL